MCEGIYVGAKRNRLTNTAVRHNRTQSNGKQQIAATTTAGKIGWKMLVHSRNAEVVVDCRPECERERYVMTFTGLCVFVRAIDLVTAFRKRRNGFDRSNGEGRVSSFSGTAVKRYKKRMTL